MERLISSSAEVTEPQRPQASPRGAGAEALRAKTADRPGKESSDGQITQEKCPASLLTFKNQTGKCENNLQNRVLAST